MFGLGTSEILVILIVGLVILGPSKLPGIVKAIGKGIREFKHALETGQDERIDKTPEPKSNRPES